MSNSQNVVCCLRIKNNLYNQSLVFQYINCYLAMSELSVLNFPYQSLVAKIVKLLALFCHLHRNLYFSGDSSFQPPPFQLVDDVFPLHFDPVRQRVADDVTRAVAALAFPRQPSTLGRRRQRTQRTGNSLQNLSPRISDERYGQADNLWMHVL